MSFKKTIESFHYLEVEIFPGERVLFATTSSHSTRLRFGIYEGFIVDKYNPERKYPVVSYEEEKYNYKKGAYEKTVSESILWNGRLFSVRHF